MLANYGLENLRFITPVSPGDAIRVELTAKQITPRETDEYGEVRWDAVIRNQNDELVATYDVLTLVAKELAASRLSSGRGRIASETTRRIDTLARRTRGSLARYCGSRALATRPAAVAALALTARS